MLDAKLYTLLQAYECGSFIGAARELSITQPAVSHHIKALEEELGVRIFDRSSGRLMVTQEGEEVVRCAKKMMGLYQNLRQTLSDRRLLELHLTVGITHTAESNSIAEALAKYCTENDHVNIKMITGNINNLYTKLKNYEIDLAIVEGRTSDPGIQYLLLDTDYLVLAVSTEHPFAKRSSVTLNELKQERMILRLPNSGTRDLLSAHLHNIATIKDLIRRNFGLSILPRSVCLDELRKKKIAIVPVENLTITREICMAYQSGFVRLDVLQEIAEKYNEVLRTYRAAGW